MAASTSPEFSKSRRGKKNSCHYSGARWLALRLRHYPKSGDGGTQALQVSTTHKTVMEFKRDLFKNRTKESFGISKPNNQSAITRKLNTSPKARKYKTTALHRLVRRENVQTQGCPETHALHAGSMWGLQTPPWRRNHRQDSLRWMQKPSGKISTIN